MAIVTVRMIAPFKQGSGVKHYNGQTYNDAPGTAADYQDHIANHLEGNGYTRVGISGVTAARPVATVAPYVYKGMQFVDTTLGKLIVFDGSVWRDPISGASV